jgi:DNA (cytosine-5)-methyltransferase 1
MIYGSVCSGIEAVSVAWEPLGFWPAWFAEIDPFCSALLAHRYPDVENLGDFTAIQDICGPIDILAAGTPCGSFSLAGRRGGLEDARGKLAIEFCRLAGRLRPRWIVWENVPGVLSSNGGRDFGAILGALAELGYGCSWRVLDARFFGVPQRRRRVFVVGHLGDWRRAAAVLLEREGLRRDTPARRKAGEEVAGCLGGGTGECRWHNDFDRCGASPPMSAQEPHGGGFDASCGAPPIAFTAKDYAADAGHVAPTLRAMPHAASHANGGGQVAICVQEGRVDARKMKRMAVRRLLPVECERLLGMPDDYTLIPYRGKPAADGPRYRAIGNSMAVPVMRWIGRRIQMVDGIRG